MEQFNISRHATLDFLCYYDIQQKNFIQGPVIITQYKERADDLVTEAESKLRSVLN